MRGRRFRMIQDITPTVEAPPADLSGAYFERRIARLLIVMYYCGTPVNSLLEGDTRQIDSMSLLQQFDFWVREPGHLTLALIQAYAATPALFATETVNQIRGVIEKMLGNDYVDTRRIIVPWNSWDDVDQSLSFLTSRALVSDRPSFSKLGTHQIILEAAGCEFTERILKECPTFDWYRVQAQAVLAFLPILQTYDLGQMTYLAPDLTPTAAGSMPLVPVIRKRYEAIFGEFLNADL